MRLGPMLFDDRGRPLAPVAPSMAGDSLVFQLIAIIPGPLLGAVLMLAGKASVSWVNTFSSLVYALTVPISVIGLTQAYMRYRDRPDAIPAARSIDPVPPPLPDDAAAPGTVNA